MRLNKLHKYIILTGFIFFLSATNAFCQSPDFKGNAGSGVAGTYTITMKKLEISIDGTAWITLGENTQNFNIASASVGSSLGTYVNNNNVPGGTYTKIRMTISRTIVFKGRSGLQGGFYYYTTTDKGKSGDFYVAGNATAWNSVNNQPAGIVVGAYASNSIKVPDDATAAAGETMDLTSTDMIITKTLSSAITIGEGATVNSSMSFDTQSMIGFQGTAPNPIAYPMPPKSTCSED